MHRYAEGLGYAMLGAMLGAIPVVIALNVALIWRMYYGG